MAWYLFIGYYSTAPYGSFIMRQFRFIFIAVLASFFVINSVFLRKAIAILLCGVLNFNSASCYSFLSDYEIADAAISLSRTVTASDHAGGVQKDGQEVAICLFGVCADIPKIPVLVPKSSNQNQPNPTDSSQRPVNGVQEQPTASNNEKPTADLTGAWDTDRLGSICRVDSCILATPSVPSLTVSDKTGRVVSRISITQSGNQISIPDLKFVWNGGYYTYKYTKGNISGNKVTLYETAVDTSVGWGYTNIYTGTVSVDGNTIEGEVVYQPSAGNNGNNTAKTKFTWKRKNSLPRANAAALPANSSSTTTLANNQKSPSTNAQKAPQVNSQAPRKYPCENFSVNESGKIPSDVPQTEEEKKEFEFAQPSNPGLIVPNYLYKQGNIPDGARLAKAYGGNPNDWNEHRTPGFKSSGRTIYLRWFRRQYSVVDYEYKFVAECSKKKRKVGRPKEYTCDAFKEGFKPYWKGIHDAAAKYADSEYPISDSLLAAIASQESGGSWATVPHNIQEQKSNGFGFGPYQLDYSGAKGKPYNHKSITPIDLLDPNVLTNYPDLGNYFDKKGATPQQALDDPEIAAQAAASILEQGFNYGDGDLATALGYYNGGKRGADDNSLTTPQDWGNGEKLNYPDSVKRHKALIDDAIKHCGTPTTAK